MKHTKINIPRAYKRNPATKLLWLYKASIISMIQYIDASNRLYNQEVQHD